MDDNRLTALLQIFTLILVFKGISATYLATKYSVQNQIEIINQAIYVLKIIPVFLFISLLLISFPLVFSKINKRLKKYLDILAIIIILVGLLVLFFL